MRLLDQALNVLTGRGDTPPAPHLSLALQGGGAHGAFTWGVLDHLLGDERIEIAGISGASAGAMNVSPAAMPWRTRSCTATARRCSRSRMPRASIAA